MYFSLPELKIYQDGVDATELWIGYTCLLTPTTASEKEMLCTWQVL